MKLHKGEERMKKANIFGGIKVWGRFNFNLPRKFSFMWLKEWDWASWFWFIILTGIVGMGIAAVLIQMYGDPTPVMPATGGWDG